VWQLSKMKLTALDRSRVMEKFEQEYGIETPLVAHVGSSLLEGSGWGHKSESTSKVGNATDLQWKEKAGKTASAATASKEAATALDETEAATRTSEETEGAAASAGKSANVVAASSEQPTVTSAFADSTSKVAGTSAASGMNAVGMKPLNLDGDAQKIDANVVLRLLPICGVVLCMFVAAVCCCAMCLCFQGRVFRSINKDQGAKSRGGKQTKVGQFRGQRGGGEQNKEFFLNYLLHQNSQNSSPVCGQGCSMPQS